MRISVVQMNPGADKSENIAQARRLIGEAVDADRPDIVSLPEVWDSLGGDRAVRNANAEPPAITRAKQFIKEHQADEISLGDVAKAVNTSTFYFCKMFKKATGLNFTDYLSRVRVEKARNLLLNPNLRISEIAFAAGFQSLSHFNRVFRRIAGESPTRYREKLPRA